MEVNEVSHLHLVHALTKVALCDGLKGVAPPSAAAGPTMITQHLCHLSVSMKFCLNVYSCRQRHDVMQGSGKAEESNDFFLKFVSGVGIYNLFYV